MKIYVDYDDCLCETAKAFTGIASRLFGKNVPYEEVRFFNLQDSFKLNDEEYEQLMIEGHRPQVLLSYEETPGAADTINGWIDSGHEVYIITGRVLHIGQLVPPPKAGLSHESKQLSGQALVCKTHITCNISIMQF